MRAPVAWLDPHGPPHLVCTAAVPLVEPGVLPEGACPLGLGSGGAYPPEQLGEPADVRCAAAAGSGGRAPAGRSAGLALRGSSAAADRSSRQPSNPQKQPQQQHQQQQQPMAMLPAAQTPSPPQHALPSPQTAPPLQSPQSMAPQASTQQQQPGPQGLLRPPAVHPPPSQQQRALPLVQPRAVASQPGLQQAAGQPAPRAAASGAALPLRPLLPNLLLPGALPPSRAPPPPRPCSLLCHAIAHMHGIFIGCLPRWRQATPSLRSRRRPLRSGQPLRGRIPQQCSSAALGCHRQHGWNPCIIDGSIPAPFSPMLFGRRMTRRTAGRRFRRRYASCRLPFQESGGTCSSAPLTRHL